LSQGQFDALVSFTYNEGTGRPQSSTLLKVLNAGDYAAVPAELMEWVFGGGKSCRGW
jgi:lysozyme